MTLSELAYFISRKTGKVDTNSLIAIKDFIKNRYKMIWESELWDDSKIIVTQSLAADTLELTVNSLVDLVISVSWKGKKLENISAETVFNYNPEMINQSGGPISYVNMPKSSGACVIRFITKPQTTEDVMIVGKKVFTDLTGDSDSPLLRGIDNALLAFAEADFLERENRRGSAQLKLQEANVMFQKMVDLERNQQTKNIRIIPAIYDLPRTQWRSNATQIF